MVEVYLGLGSNIEPRKEYIDKAISLLSSYPHVTTDRISEIIETEPWGFSSDTYFLNCVVKILVDSALTPQQLLRDIKKIESNLGRDEKMEYFPDGSRLYHSRTIDIDILLWGSQRVNEDNLTIPHPLIKQRKFVIIPLKQVISREMRERYHEIFE